MSSSPPALLTPPETPNDALPSPLSTLATAVSPTFYPDAHLDPSSAPDLVVISSDGTLFYVHSKLLLQVSRNAFSGLLPASERGEAGPSIPAIRVQSDATLLDLVLRIIYGLDITACNPPLTLLSLVVDELLERFAVPPLFVLWPGRPLFAAILAHAVVHPLHVYSLAARRDLETLAVAASAHMLSFPLALLTDDDARVIGPVYLRRLFFLHLGRVEALKRILVVQPAAHAPTAQCDALSQQQKMQRAWKLATAGIALDARPDLSPHAIEAALGPLQTHVWCMDCRRMLSDRTQKLVAEWSAVKRTI